MRNVSRMTIVFLSVAALASAAEKREVRGRVVDDAGRPVAGAAVGEFWRANGPLLDPQGKPYDLKRPEDVRAFWGGLGRMEPSTAAPTVTGPDGRFSMKVPNYCRGLMAMDPARTTGGLTVLPEGKGAEPVLIRLGPLVKVHGRIEGPAAGERPTWTHVYTLLPDDPARPIDSGRLVSCGSFEARFEMSLPPGRYVLQAYNDPLDAYVNPSPEVDLTGAARDVDLGVLKLSSEITHTSVKIAKAKAAGAWGDLAKRYGQESPPWHLTDARGLSKDAKLADFKGKWVLLYFWGFGCAPCLKTGLPNMATFYDDHAADRDRFEIIAVCLDDDGKLKSMADLDGKLGPVVEHVWGGKRLPFPIALDASFRTQESFGLATYGPVLIDPAGRLTRGDEKRLAEALKTR